MREKKQKKTIENSQRQKFGKELNFASVEAYNLLRTNLSFSLPDKVGGKTIGITSPCPQEGKSTTSLNLAYSLAEAGNKVLLVDADLRRPSLASIIETSMVPGLSNLLIDNNTEGAVREGLLHENLSVLPAGDIPPNPSELIGSDRMKQLIEKFETCFDHIILDLPPVNSVSDPLAMSKHIDGMIVVVRHGQTKRREITETVRQLELVNAKVFGFVYNGYHKTKAGYKRK